MVLQIITNKRLTMVSEKAPKQEKQKTILSVPPNLDVQPCCWICLDNMPDDDWKCVVRDCACRGDSAGYAHVSCLIQYATKKNIQDERAAEKGGRPLDVDSLIQPWTDCPNCKQTYQGDVGLALATSLYEGVQHLPECDLAFIQALHSMAQALMRNSKYPQAKNYLERAVRIVKNELKQEHTNIRSEQIMALTVFSEMAHLLANKLGDFHGAIPYKKECIKLCKALYGEQDLTTKSEQQDLYFMKSLLEIQGGIPVSSFSPQQREKYFSLKLKQAEFVYENSLDLHGEDDWETISLKGTLGEFRCIQGETKEGLKLMEEAFHSCHRIFGPDHQNTAEIAHMHLRRKSIHGLKVATLIGTKRRNGTEVTVLKIRPDGSYLVRLNSEDGPIKVFKASPHKLMLHEGTYIRVRDGRQGMVQSFDEANQSYTLNVKGVGGTQKVKAKDCTVIFS